MTHSPVKQMLKEAGLKMSLARLKVIDALWEASGSRAGCRSAPCTGVSRNRYAAVPGEHPPGPRAPGGKRPGDLDEQDVYSPGKASWGGAAGSAAPERAAANEQRL